MVMRQARTKTNLQIKKIEEQNNTKHKLMNMKKNMMKTIKIYHVPPSLLNPKNMRQI